MLRAAHLLRHRATAEDGRRNADVCLALGLGMRYARYDFVQAWAGNEAHVIGVEFSQEFRYVAESGFLLSLWVSGGPAFWGAIGFPFSGQLATGAGLGIGYCF